MLVGHRTPALGGPGSGSWSDGAEGVEKVRDGQRTGSFPVEVSTSGEGLPGRQPRNGRGGRCLGIGSLGLTLAFRTGFCV